MRSLLVLLVCVAFGVTACDSKGSPTRPADLTHCTRVGQTCEVSPNKLGSCVQRDDCTGDCLVCQSQH